ncbi:MAG: transposase [Phycisphaeraceae bacterium]
MSQEHYEALPQSLVLRELRYHVRRRGFRTRTITLVTTLLDHRKYPADQVAQLYGLRWRVETHFAQLKTTLSMRRLKCQSVDGIQKELAAYCLVYNLVHMIMLQAAWRQNVAPDRISFLDAVRWLLSAAPGDALPTLIVNPHRPGRHQPRVIKDLQDTYRKMTRSRAYLRRLRQLTRR